MRRWMLASLLATALAGAAHRRHALSPSGATGAAAVGTAVFGAGGLRGSALLLLFFGSSTALSRLSGGGRGAREGPRRTLAQVLANGGLPAALAVCDRSRPSPRVAASYAGALAAANADTWATEIGRFSPTPPRLITNGARVAAGTDGGMTLLGTVGGIAGAGLIAGLAVGLGPGGSGLGLAMRVAVAGIIGMVLDSLLGATVQGKVRWVDNDAVNLAATLTGAVCAGLIA